MSQGATFQKIPERGNIVKVYLTKRTIISAKEFGVPTHTFGRVREVVKRFMKQIVILNELPYNKFG